MSKKTLWTILIIISVIVSFLILLFLSLNNKKTVTVIPHIGHIQVLNACSIGGAAGEVSNYLRNNGFDVVEVGNNDEWYFKNTIVASRNKNMKIAKDVAFALNTKNVLLLRKKGIVLDATVFVGKDYKKLIGSK